MVGYYLFGRIINLSIKLATRSVSKLLTSVIHFKSLLVKRLIMNFTWKKKIVKNPSMKKIKVLSDEGHKRVFITFVKQSAEGLMLWQLSLLQHPDLDQEEALNTGRHLYEPWSSWFISESICLPGHYLVLMQY